MVLFSVVAEMLHMFEHFGILLLTGKRVKGDCITSHFLLGNQLSYFEDFSVFITKYNSFKITIMESLLNNRNHPPLNKTKEFH